MGRTVSWIAAVMLASAACGGTSPPDTAAPVLASAPVGSAAPSAVALRVVIYDDTEKRPLRGRTETWLRGAGSWFPDIAQGGDARVLPARPIGSTDPLMFYPTGRDGEEIAIPLQITPELCPQGCDRDALIIRVYDDRFEIIGEPVGATQVIKRR